MAGKLPLGSSFFLLLKIWSSHEINPGKHQIFTWEDILDSGIFLEDVKRAGSYCLGLSHFATVFSKFSAGLFGKITWGWLLAGGHGWHLESTRVKLLQRHTKTSETSPNSTYFSQDIVQRGKGEHNRSTPPLKQFFWWENAHRCSVLIYGHQTSSGCSDLSQSGSESSPQL